MSSDRPHVIPTAPHVIPTEGRNPHTPTPDKPQETAPAHPKTTPPERTSQMSHCDTLIRYENATPVAFWASPRYKLYATL